MFSLYVPSLQSQDILQEQEVNGFYHKAPATYLVIQRSSKSSNTNSKIVQVYKGLVLHTQASATTSPNPPTPPVPSASTPPAPPPVQSASTPPAPPVQSLSTPPASPPKSSSMPLVAPKPESSTPGPVPSPVSQPSKAVAAPPSPEPSPSPEGTGLNGPDFGSAVAYTPYNADQSCKTTSQVAADFQKIHGFEVVRLYGTDCNQISNVIAATQGSVKLLLGIFDINSIQSEVQSISSVWLISMLFRPDMHPFLSRRTCS